MGLLEEEIGIRLFLGKSPSFVAVLKQRFSDFLVNEVDQEGNVLHLSDLTSRPPVATTSTSFFSSSSKTEDDKEKELKDWEAQVGSAFNPLIGEKSTKELIEFSKVTEDQQIGKKIFLKVVGDKSKRTQVHQLVKKFFKNLMTDTLDHIPDQLQAQIDAEENPQAHTEEAKYLRVIHSKEATEIRRDSRWAADLPKFIHMSMLKENKDTSEAVDIICRLLKVKPKVVGYAGTKDKRGVTVQRISLNKVPIDKLIKLNDRLFGIKIGNFKYANEPLRLGDLKGNQFTVVLRGINIKSEELELAVKELETTGFINYFGAQRFGTYGTGTHRVGMALLQGDYEKAFSLILAKDESIRSHWEKTKDIVGTLKLLPPKSFIERLVLNALKKIGPKAYVNAIEMLPRNLRMLYVHSVQSYIFNLMVTERIQLYGHDKPVIGDLVLIDGSDVIDNMVDDEDDEENLVDDQGDGGKRKRNETREGGEKRTKNSSSSKNKDDNGDQDDDDVNDDDDDDQNPKEGSSRRAVIRAKVLTSEEEVKNYSISDVVLTLPGSDVIYPTNAIGDKYRHLLESIQFDFSKSHNKFFLPGSYRKIVAKPVLKWSIYKYDDFKIPLCLTDMDILDKKPAPVSVPDGQYTAMVVEFILPPSCYATMCIRELCKQSSTVFNQKSLNAYSDPSSSSTSSSAPAPAPADSSVSSEGK